MQLNEKHILVTGAAKRVARHFVERLLKVPKATPLKITAHYHRSENEVAELVVLAKSNGHELKPVSADLRKVSAIEHLAATALKNFGPVDILVNSASDFFSTPALTCTEEEWDSLLDLNLKGQFFLAQACAKSMTKRAGVVINLIDIYAERSSRNFAAYAASKGGLLTLTRALAKEWAPQIRVNGVSPGAVLFPEHYTQEQKDKAIDRSLLKRAGTPDDIAEAIFFLISNEYITGINLCVDGGRSIA